MCLILFAIEAHADYPLVLAANRDEYFSRPTRCAAHWPEAPAVIGGRDLEAGGSWLGLHRDGRLAAVTNVREPPRHKPGLESRGALVADYLRDDHEPEPYLDEVIRRRHRFDGFNLLLGRTRRLYFYAGRSEAYRPLESGIHGMSNGDPDTAWPKVARGRAALGDCLAQTGPPDLEALFAILADTTPAADEELPDTGVGLELERRLAPIFVRLDGYGTRCSTVLTVDASGTTVFCERSFSEDGTVINEARFEFELESG